MYKRLEQLLLEGLSDASKKWLNHARHTRGLYKLNPSKFSTPIGPYIHKSKSEEAKYANSIPRKQKRENSRVKSKYNVEQSLDYAKDATTIHGKQSVHAKLGRDHAAMVIRNARITKSKPKYNRYPKPPKDL